MAKKKHSTPGRSGEKPVILQQIVVKAPQRRVYDVGDWRAALRAADNGRTKQLYDLYEDIMIDGVLSDAVQKRIDAVANSELTFQNAQGEEVEEISSLMDSTAWESLLTGIIKVRFYGRSGVELGFSDGFTVCPIPPKHIDLAHRTILINDTDESGIPFEGDNHLLVLGYEHDFGLLLKAAPYAIYKRGGFGDWSQWVELFGMPQRVGKYNTYDPASRKLLEEAFEKAGSAPYVVIPKEAEVETKESNSGSGTSYDEFRKANNEEILITILGQTMTTVQGDKGARSLGEVHKEVEEGKNASDLRFVERVLNQRVRPMLEARGFPVAGGKFVFPKAAVQLSVGEIVQLSGIIDIPQSYLHEKYSIPAPKDGEPVARRAAGPLFDDPGDSGEETTVENADRGFLRRMWDFFVGAPQDGASSGNPRINLSDNPSMEDRLIAGIAGGTVGTFYPELFDFISGDLLNAVRGAFKRSLNNADMPYAHAYGLRDDAFITALEMNLFRFSAGKTLAEVQALNKAFRDSGSYGEFEKKAREICGTFNRTWQKTEYDTAVLTAESASNYHRLKGKTRLFPCWKYVTAGDDRVREEHRALDGVVLEASDPRWKKIFPPNGWKCRCRVTPLMRHETAGVNFKEMRRIVDDYLGSAEWKQNAAQGWDVNRGDTAEIFGKNQQYIRKFPDKAAKCLDRLYYNDYGLGSLSKMIAAAKTTAPAFTGDPAEWHASHQTLSDYMGRQVSLTEGVFKKHTSGSYVKTRVPLLGCIQDVLSNPDEVWLNDYVGKFRNLNFIKFYEGKAVNVVCEVKDGKVYQVTTWFEIEQAPKKSKPGKMPRHRDTRWMYRRGLLIKKS